MKKILKSSAKVLAVLGVLFQANAVIKRKSDLSLYPDTLKDKDLFFNSRFGDIRYRALNTGNGKPKIVLLHSLMVGGSLDEFSYLSSMLSKDFEVYAIDMLGFGYSDRPNISYNSYLYVSIITEFLNSVVKDEAVVVASGMSADFAIMKRELDDTFVKHLVLINPKGIMGTNSYGNIVTRVMKKIVFLPIIGTFISNIISSRKNIKSMLQSECFLNPNLVTNEIVESYYKFAHYKCEENRYPLSYLFASFLNVDTKNEILNTKYKTTIILGEDISEFDSYFAKEKLIKNENIDTHILPMSKTLVTKEKPIEVYKIISYACKK